MKVELKLVTTKEDKNIAKYTLIAGVFAAIALGIVYVALSYVGAQTSVEASLTLVNLVLRVFISTRTPIFRMR